MQLADSARTQRGYLFGSSQNGGWWYWYAMAFVIKVPLPTLYLIAVSIFRLPEMTEKKIDVATCSYPTCCRDEEVASIRWAALCLILPATEVALLIASTTGTGTNAAFRYLFPTIALLCVWLGYVAFKASRRTHMQLICLTAIMAMTALSSFPNHIGWRNVIGWATEQWTGCPALIGDSLDWGQDAGRLATWLKQNPVRGSTIVCIYGFGDGKIYGLEPPLTQLFNDSYDKSCLIAVSENVLFSYASPGSIMKIGSGRLSLNSEQCEALLRIENFTRIGSSIRLYRLSDLPAVFFR